MLNFNLKFNNLNKIYLKQLKKKASINNYKIIKYNKYFLKKNIFFKKSKNYNYYRFYNIYKRCFHNQKLTKQKYKLKVNTKYKNRLKLKNFIKKNFLIKLKKIKTKKLKKTKNKKNKIKCFYYKSLRLPFRVITLNWKQKIIKQINQRKQIKIQNLYKLKFKLLKLKQNINKLKFKLNKFKIIKFFSKLNYNKLKNKLLKYKNLKLKLLKLKPNLKEKSKWLINQLNPLTINPITKFPSKFILKLQLKLKLKLKKQKQLKLNIIE